MAIFLLSFKYSVCHKWLYISLHLFIYAPIHLFNFDIIIFYFRYTYYIQYIYIFLCIIYIKHYIAFIQSINERAKVCSFKEVLKSRDHDIRPKKILKAISVLWCDEANFILHVIIMFTWVHENP